MAADFNRPIRSADFKSAATPNRSLYIMKTDADPWPFCFLMANYRQFDDYYDFGPPRHSGPGVASFVIGVAAGFIDLVMFLVALVMEASQAGNFGPGTTGTAMVLMGMCAALLAAMAGAGLGIAGVCQRNRKTIFAVLGLILNALLLVGGGCLFLVFLLAGNV